MNFPYPWILQRHKNSSSNPMDFGNTILRIQIFYFKILIHFNKRKINLERNLGESFRELKGFIASRRKILGDSTEARKWYEVKSRTIRFLFEYEEIREFIFEKFSDLWKKSEKTEDRQIYAIITQVSIANAVLAGLPGKMGIGVFVCIALEFYMALAIARRIGFEISEEDLWSKFKDLSGYGLYFTFVGFIAIYAFKHMFGFVFSIIPGILPQTVITEYIVTTFVGILFWEAFEQTRTSFFLDKILRSSYRRTKELLSYQWDALKHTLSKKNILDVGQKIRAWLTGDFMERIPKIRGDVFVSISFASLLRGHRDSLAGPLGEVFMESIRDRWPDLSDASIDEISTYMSTNYSDEQIPGVINTIKGKFFENLSEIHENADGDEWTARLHEDESYPGSDMIITNSETGETMELSLKATSNENYLESALLRYPDVRILSTSEVADEFGDLDRVIASEFSNKEIEEITELNFDELVNRLVPFKRSSVVSSAAIGVAVATIVGLWPFVVAYMRKRITLEQLRIVCERVFPDIGRELVYRVTFSIVLGLYTVGTCLQLPPTLVRNQD